MVRSYPRARARAGLAAAAARYDMLRDAEVAIDIARSWQALRLAAGGCDDLRATAGIAGGMLV
jgi:hypothetical protein